MSRIRAAMKGSLRAEMAEEVEIVRRGVSTGLRAQGVAIKNHWRAQIRAAGLGSRLPNTIRDKFYPNQGFDSAVLVYTNAPHIIGTFERGATIETRLGKLYLAIPTENVPRGGRRRFTPGNWPEARFGKLFPIYRPGKPIVLAVRMRATVSRATGGLKFRRVGGGKKSTSLKGLTIVPMFILLSKVTLRKRLSLLSDAQRMADGLPEMIVRAMEAMDHAA